MKRVLVVDDSRVMRNIVKNTFETLKIPCHYFEAENGQEAFEIIERESIDLVLLDWNMPRLSGYDFLKKVRLIEKYRKLPVIMVTSESARYNVIDALKAGATDYIVKPVNLKIFTEKMKKVFT